VTPLGNEVDWKEFPTRYNHSFELTLWYLLLHEYLKKKHIITSPSAWVQHTIHCSWYSVV